MCPYAFVIIVWKRRKYYTTKQIDYSWNYNCHHGDYEDMVFRIILRSSLETSRRFGGTYHLYLHARRVKQARNRKFRLQLSYLAYFSTENIEPICSSETLGCLHGFATHKIISSNRSLTLEKKEIPNISKVLIVTSVHRRYIFMCAVWERRFTA
jgi:hypothetical protein